MGERVPTRLVTFGERDRDVRVEQLRIRVIGRPWLVRGQRSNPFSFRILEELRTADVVHCHQQHVLCSSVAAFASRVMGTPVYCTDLGGGGWDVSAYVSTDGLYNGHLHISEYSQSVFGHARKAGAHVILGGVDSAKFSPAEDSSWSGPRPVLLVGRLLPHKGVDVLIRALPAHMPAHIVGPAPDARYLADLKALAAGKAVTFRHDCDDEALVNAYRHASCIVLPSVYRDMYGAETQVPELLGQTLLEGMACGIPAICTAVASMPEIVDHGVTGFVVPPNDPSALADVLQQIDLNPERARTMGLAARAVAMSRFSWDSVVDRCLDAYSIHSNLPAMSAAAIER
jgi:glycosyltransferase involved in cell wall biosynthesis